eukprot:13752010-Alexandrium_andersonii.AAC.1
MRAGRMTPAATGPGLVGIPLRVPPLLGPHRLPCRVPSTGIVARRGSCSSARVRVSGDTDGCDASLDPFTV